MIFQLQLVPGHFSHIPTARCGCSFGMCTCLQLGRVFPTEIGKLLQFCEFFPFEGVVCPIPAETLGNPGSHWGMALLWSLLFWAESFSFLLKTETWRCWSPRELSRVSRELWGCWNGTKWYKNESLPLTPSEIHLELLKKKSLPLKLSKTPLGASQK